MILWLDKGSECKEFITRFALCTDLTRCYVTRVHNKNNLSQFQGSRNIFSFKMIHILLNLEKPLYTFNTPPSGNTELWQTAVPSMCLSLTLVWINLRDILAIIPQMCANTTVLNEVQKCFEYYSVLHHFHWSMDTEYKSYKYLYSGGRGAWIFLYLKVSVSIKMKIITLGAHWLFCGKSMGHNFIFQ